LEDEEGEKGLDKFLEGIKKGELQTKEQKPPLWQVCKYNFTQVKRTMY